MQLEKLVKKVTVWVVHTYPVDYIMMASFDMCVGPCFQALPDDLKTKISLIPSHQGALPRLRASADSRAPAATLPNQVKKKVVSLCFGPKDLSIYTQVTLFQKVITEHILSCFIGCYRSAHIPNINSEWEDGWVHIPSWRVEFHYPEQESCCCCCFWVPLVCSHGRGIFFSILFSTYFTPIDISRT